MQKYVSQLLYRLQAENRPDLEGAITLFCTHNRNTTALSFPMTIVLFSRVVPQVYNRNEINGHDLRRGLAPIPYLATLQSLKVTAAAAVGMTMEDVESLASSDLTRFVWPSGNPREKQPTALKK